jgi:ABC-type branched-subunit amino acid transport system substrate-binding protein
MRKVTKGLAPLVALALVAAACGGDDDDDGGGATAEDTGGSEETADTGDMSEETGDMSEETGDMSEETGDMSEETGDMSEETGGGEVDPASIAFDYGVTEDTIRIGMNADLSGIFASTVTPIVDAQEVFWETVNEQGGVAGRQVELIVKDNAYDVPTHLENYEEFASEGDDGVIFISQSTGSPHTAATAEMLVEDNLVAIPLSWYSGWADPTIGQNVMELYTLYCIEAMNGVEYLAGDAGASTIGIVSFPGEYGQDGATGAKIAAEALGLEVVYDGEGAAVPGADQTPVITELVEADPDIVWSTVNGSTLAEIMGGAYAQGLRARWSGNAPSWDPDLLGTDFGTIADELYTYSAYTALWDAVESPGMDTLKAAMREKRPDAQLEDTYIWGWTEGLATLAVLEQAAANGDMTRAGVVQAFNEVSVDFQGLAPDQEWFGEPNDFIVRESYLFDVDQSLYNPDATVSDDAPGATGVALLEGPYAGEIASNYDFQGACFTAE